MVCCFPGAGKGFPQGESRFNGANNPSAKAFLEDDVVSSVSGI
jgi:hypothetical protein